MRRLWGILLAALISTGAHAQSTARVGYAADGNGSQPFTYVSSSTPLPVSGSFSAGSFAPGGSFANLTSTASSADAALPTGTTVALFNTGTTAVSCTLTVGAGSSTANKNIIQASSWFAVSVGSNTHYSCINQAGDGASNVVVASGGSGLPAGAGGGGGGSSSNASVGSTGSAVPSSATYVGVNSGGNLTGWDGSVNLTKIGGTSINSGCVAALSGLSAAVPSTICPWMGVYVINALAPGANNSANSSPVVIANDQVCTNPTHAFKHITTATDTLAVQGVTAQTVRLCAWTARAAGTATWFWENTASTNANCVSTLTQIAGVRTEAINTGEVVMMPIGVTLNNTSGNGLCINSTGTGGVDIDYWYQQR